MVEETILDRIIETVKDNNEKLEHIIDSLERADENVLISCVEASRLLGVTPTTITSLLNRHKLHKVTIGRSTGIRLSEIRGYTNSQ